MSRAAWIGVVLFAFIILSLGNAATYARRLNALNSIPAQSGSPIEIQGGQGAARSARDAAVYFEVGLVLLAGGLVAALARFRDRTRD